MTESRAAAATIWITLLAVALFWVTPLNSSLWLDETGTAWAAKGTLDDVVNRAYHPGQPSVLFSLVMWAAVALGGFHELTLRLPSLAACLLATVCIYRLARRFCDREGSLLAAALFATYGTVAFAAADARPYALALLCVTAAMLMLVKWCESGELKWGVAYAVLAALSVAFHYLCLSLLPVHFAYLLIQDLRPRARHLQGIGFLLAGLLSLLVPHATVLWQARQEHSFTGIPELRDVIDALIYYRLAAGVVLGISVARLLYPELSIRAQALFTPRHTFLLTWYLCPVLLLLGISLVSDAKLLVGRYYLWGVPGLAILAASALSAVEPLPARRIAGLVILLIFCARRIPYGPAGHGGQDWRGALLAARTEMHRTGSTLLLRSGFPEAPAGITDDPLLAPLALYPVAGTVRIASCWVNDADTARMEELVSRLVKDGAPFLYISPSDYQPPATWLLGRLSRAPYDSSSLGAFQGITAIKFDPR